MPVYTQIDRRTPAFITKFMRISSRELKNITAITTSWTQMVIRIIWSTMAFIQMTLRD